MRVDNLVSHTQWRGFFLVRAGNEFKPVGSRPITGNWIETGSAKYGTEADTAPVTAVRFWGTNPGA